jgi:hypothetical protein
MSDIEEIIRDFDCLGIKHITISFIKLYQNQIKKVSEKVGFDIGKIIEKKNKEFFIKKEIRMKMAQKIKDVCNSLGLTFAMCREAIMEDTGFCDPFHLIAGYKPKKENKNFKKITEF